MAIKSYLIEMLVNVDEKEAENLRDSIQRTILDHAEVDQVVTENMRPADLDDFNEFDVDFDLYMK